MMSSTDRITVFGSSGFIGRNLVEKLRSEGFETIDCPNRDERVSGRDLGTVYYCCGMTGDFRSDIPNLIEAHVSNVVRLVSENTAGKIIYLSSARVYGSRWDGSNALDETSEIVVQPNDLDYVYNASKIMGEMSLRGICEAAGVQWCALRLSNVVGFDPLSPNSLWQLLREAAETEVLTFRSSPDSGKDYVALDDVLMVMVKIAQSAESGIFNVVSGRNTTNVELAESLCEITGVSPIYENSNRVLINAPISNCKIKNLLGITPATGIEDLPVLWKSYHQWKSSHS